MSNATATKIRAGLYALGSYLIEDYYQDGTGWVWRVTNSDSFFDPWFGDFDTKRAAVAAIAETV
jgi:hypothetical protein